MPELERIVTLQEYRTNLILDYINVQYELDKYQSKALIYLIDSKQYHTTYLPTFLLVSTFGGLQIYGDRMTERQRGTTFIIGGVISTATFAFLEHRMNKQLNLKKNKWKYY